MKPLTLSNIRAFFRDKRVCVVGSAPSGLDNDGEYIDSFDVIVRVNNYKTKGRDKHGRNYDFTGNIGSRTDYHYSYYGGAIRKTNEELKRDGVKAFLCKCPNDVCHVTEWHKQNNQIQGGDFRPIYRRRADFWQDTPVYIPHKAHYMQLFEILNKHVPSTGLACIWEVIGGKPKELYITGFDFMTTPIHNVNETWKKGREDDPVKHDFYAEKKLVNRWVKDNDFIHVDNRLKEVLA